MAGPTTTNTGSGAQAAFGATYTPLTNESAAAQQNTVNPVTAPTYPQNVTTTVAGSATGVNLTATQTVTGVNNGFTSTTGYPKFAVNMGDFELFKFHVNELNAPFSLFGINLNNKGVQTTPALARGFLPGSAIELLNNNLAHVCDVKFIFNFDLDLTLGLINPLTAIRNAIKNARMNATNMLRNLVYKAMQAIRLKLDAILATLNFDPSGAFSFYWSLGKSIVKKINKVIQDIAEAIEIVLSYVFLVQQIQQLIAWIKSLPDKLKALLAECVANFTNSILQVAETFKSIPDQIANATQGQLDSITGQFVAAGNELLSAVQNKQTSSDIPDGVAAALASDTSNGFSDAFQSHADSIVAYSSSKMSESMANKTKFLYTSP
jgi:hypothetical protein